MRRTILKQRYLLQDLLGEGGMGRVFRAVDTRTGAGVAVKLLADDARGNVRLMRSLAREVRAVARLHHPHIVQVVDYGQSEDDNPFFVMEYVPGTPLETCQDRLSVRDVLEIADQILAALAYAHARGVIHRDLKPENVIVVERGDGALHAKLVDFGVARLSGLRGGEAHSTADRAPVSDVVVGTPAYMSPEQAQGLNRLVGPPSDLYALGVILFEYICGRLPFDGQSAMQILMAHVYEPTPPLDVPDDVAIPIGLDELVAALMDKSPDRRPAFAADVRRWLRKLDWEQASDVPSGDLAIRSGETRPGHAVTLAEHTIALHTDDTRSPHTTDPGKPHDIPPPPTTGVRDADGLMQTVFDGIDGEDVGQELPLVPGLFGVREVPFVGRRNERKALWATLEETLEASTSQVVIVRGEPGIGKSRLARWLAERAEEEGLMQTLGLGVGPGSALPADGLRGLVERHLRLTGLEREECAPVLREMLVESGDFAQHEIPALLSWLRPKASHTALSSGPPIDPIAVTGRILRVATRRRPVILLFDDLAGPDAAPVLDLVELLLATRNLAPLPVLAVMTVEAPEAADGEESTLADAVDSGTASRLADLQETDGVVWWRLRRMSVDDARRLASSILPLTQQLADTVAKRSDGNPQFALQIVSHWIESGLLAETPGGRLTLNEASLNIRRLPGQLVDLMQNRLGAILVATADPKGSRAVMGRAALCGRRFQIEVLEALLVREGRPELVALLDELVERLIEEGLWLEVDAGEIQFARVEIYEQVRDHLVPRSEAMLVHAHIADIKTERFADRLAEHEHEIAEHLAAAGVYDDACERFLAAGRHALAWARYNVARDRFERAAGILERHSLPDATRLADDIDLGLALCDLKTGAYDDAEARLDAIEGRLRAARRREARAHAALIRAEVTFKRGNADLAAERFRDAQLRFEALGASDGIAQSLQGLADVSRVRGDYTSGRKAAAEARAIHQAHGRRREVARCLLVEGKIAFLQRNDEKAEELLQASVRAFAKAGDQQGMLDAEAAIAGTLRDTGRLREALAMYQDLVGKFAELGDRPNVVGCHQMQASVYLRLDQLDRARDAFERTLELAESLGDQLHAARALNGLGEVARAQQRWEEAIGYYRRYVDAANALGALVSVAVGYANVGLTHVELEDWEEARDAFASAVSTARRLDNREYIAAFLTTRAVVEGHLEDWASAREAMSEALEHDAEAPGTQRDYLRALTDFHRIAHDHLPDLAERALDTAIARYRSIGADEEADAAEALRAPSS